jgi:hypothetical protein
MSSREQRPVSGHLRTLQKGPIRGRDALYWDLRHLLAFLYLVCIGVAIWLMAHDGSLLPLKVGFPHLQ